MKTHEYERNFILEEQYWWFMGMRRIYLDFIQRILRKEAPQRYILDIGCGTGIITKNLEKLGKVVGIDREPRAIEFCIKRKIPNLVVAESNNLPFKDLSIDVICAFNIIEHIKDDLSFIKEVGRVCKNKGRIFLSTSAFKFLWSEHDLANEHQRRYTKYSLRKALNIVFDSERVTYTNFFLFPLIFLIIFLKNIFHHKHSIISRSFYQVPRLLNLCLIGILRLESFLLKYFVFPIGVSLFYVGRKR